MKANTALHRIMRFLDVPCCAINSLTYLMIESLIWIIMTFLNGSSCKQVSREGCLLRRLSVKVYTVFQRIMRFVDVPCCAIHSLTYLMMESICNIYVHAFSCRTKKTIKEHCVFPPGSSEVKGIFSRMMRFADVSCCAINSLTYLIMANIYGVCSSFLTPRAKEN